MLARAGWRRRRGSLLGLALVVAIGTGVALTALEAAARTENAYPSYLRRAQVGELVVNPSLTTDRVEGIIASTPGVESYVSDSMLTATPDDGAPRTQAEVDHDASQVRVSADGRYAEQDRPVVHHGRMIHDGAEAFVNVEMADALGLHVGDTLPLAFWGNSVNGSDVPVDSLLEPFGRAEVRVVGIGVFSDEVLLDGLYPRHRALVTSEVGAAYDCTPVQPGADDQRSLDELVPVLIPPDCARSYRYYSLRVEGGDGGVGAVTSALADRFLEESGRLPAALQVNNIGFEVTPTVTSDERQRVQRSLAPAVRALQLFGVAAAISTLVLVLLGAVRFARREEHDVRIWRDLGGGRALRMAGVGVPLAGAALAGLAGSLLVGWLASGLGPVASARAIDPAGRMGLSASAVLLVVGGSVVVLAGGILVAAASASGSRSRESTPAAPSRPSRVLALSANPSLTLGIRAATAAAGGRALVGASVAAVTAVLATVVFSTSLAGLVDRPERFGWPFDVAATINYGYGETTDQAAIEATLDRPEVERWGLASLSGGLTVNEETMPYVAAGPGFDAIPLPVVEGQLPVADDEIALGSQTADRLGLGVGSRVMVNTAYGAREASVRGLVVLPPVGPFLADRTSLGTGALLSARFHQAILFAAEREAGMEPGQLVDTLGGFVAIDLRDGVDPAEFLAAISDQLPTWDVNGVPPFVYAEPVRPATVANVAAMQAVPAALAGLLALTMAIGLMLAVAVATRARSRELAVLRALGCVGRQLRSTVRWQALTVVGVGLVVGIPVGLALGRVAYRAFATDLGVVPDPLVPLPLVLALVVVTIGMGLLAAAAPGHRAGRITAGEALRHE